jgi:glycosyltransferase involved in cell wall biosynthesis
VKLDGVDATPDAPAHGRVDGATAPPLVSVVMATFNRGRVLRTAVASVLGQRLGDWELLVIGDACTDDSAAIVAAFGDDRVTFRNLPVNAGEQSVPNNTGAAAARGRYLAYLNHDDLWFPDHLERCVAHLEATGADVVYGLAVAPGPDGTPAVPGASATGRYGLHLAIPASCWVMRREAYARVGEWRPAAACITYPSHDWLRRAHRVLDIRQVPHFTALLIQSGSRPGSYVEGGDATEHERALARLQADPEALRLELVTAAARHYAAVERAPRTLRANLLRLERDAIARAVMRAGVPPMHVGMLARYRRRGRFIDELRRRRGLPPLEGR